ncbi:MAG: cytochrome c3 family protein [Desulfobaccales bacterium]
MKPESCLDCHTPHIGEEAKIRPFAATMHMKHIQAKVDLDCIACHAGARNLDFSLPGFPLGKITSGEYDFYEKAFRLWSTSPRLDALHMRNQVTCTSCHGSNLPNAGDTVEKDRCLVCHKSYEDLAKKTKPAKFPERNPHKSHIGEIDCALCHKAHKPSASYCLECHQEYKMPMKDAAEDGSKKLIIGSTGPGS